MAGLVEQVDGAVATASFLANVFSDLGGIDLIAGLPLFVNVPESMIHVKAALIEHA